MPVRYEVDQARKIVFTFAEGELTAEDLAQHASALLEDSRIAECDERVDLSRVTGFKTTVGAVRRMSTRLQQEDRNRPGGKLAFVAPADPAYGLARLYQTHRAHPNVEIRVFREHEAARSWLGLE